MKLASIGCTSMMIGVAGLALAKGAIVGVLWLGLNVGAPVTSPAEPAAATSVASLDTLRTPDNGLEDACDPALAEPAVCVTALELVDGELIVDLEYRNLDDNQIGFEAEGDVHAHVYLGDQPVETVGVRNVDVPVGGKWQVTDQTRLVVSAADIGFLTETDEVCAATATIHHTLLHEHFSCVGL